MEINLVSIQKAAETINDAKDLGNDLDSSINLWIKRLKENTAANKEMVGDLERLLRLRDDLIEATT